MSAKHNTTYVCLADSLTEEALQEAADNFFGQRRSIEHALQLYKDKVQELQIIQEEVFSAQANLHFLLRQGEEQTVVTFYRRIGIDPEKIPFPSSLDSRNFHYVDQPFALRASSRYAKLLCNVYAIFVHTVDAYMHGRYYQDPEDSRCQRLTINYNQLATFCQELQERIQRVNRDNSPTEMLQFSKKLDLERSEKEALVGVPTRYSLDEEMAFTAPDFTQSGLAHYPDFPAEERVRGTIKKMASGIYSQAPREIRDILASVG